MEQKPTNSHVAPVWTTPTGGSILQYRYDQAFSSFDIQWRGNSQCYRYLRVPLSVYLDFVKADKKGAFVNTEIKGKFDEIKLEPSEAI